MDELAQPKYIHSGSLSQTTSHNNTYTFGNCPNQANAVAVLRDAETDKWSKDSPHRQEGVVFVHEAWPVVWQ